MKVSVLIITYNHERFIAQAIESALMQRTNFDYEIVIGEDCSTDDTREIVVDFRRRFPEKIRVLLPKQNQGLLGKINLVRTLAACNGDYVAMLEGDDYWTDPYKLQKQVEFLDKNDDCVICFHDLDIIDEEGMFRSGYPGITSYKLSLSDYLSTHFNVIHAASAMLRSGVIDRLPDWYYRLPMGDWPLFILFLQRGKAGRLAESMAVWRHHAGGVWSMKPAAEIILKTIFATKVMKKHLGEEYGKLLDDSISFHRKRLAYAFASGGDYRHASAYAKAALRQRRNSWAEKVTLLKMILVNSYPELYRSYSMSKREIVRNK